jgi:hypothetical protein
MHEDEDDGFFFVQCLRIPPATSYTQQPQSFTISFTVFRVNDIVQEVSTARTYSASELPHF